MGFKRKHITQKKIVSNPSSDQLAGFILTEIIIAFFVMTLMSILTIKSITNGIVSFKKAKQKVFRYIDAQQIIEQRYAGLSPLTKDFLITQKEIGLVLSSQDTNLPTHEKITVIMVENVADAKVHMQAVVI